MADEQEVRTVPASASVYLDAETAGMLVQLQKAAGNVSRSVVIRALIRKEASGNTMDLRGHVAALRDVPS